MLPPLVAKRRAVELIRAHAWPRSEEDPRSVIHTYAGPFGSDWDVADLTQVIDQDGTTVAWRPEGQLSIGHDLIVRYVQQPAMWDPPSRGPIRRTVFVKVHRPDSLQATHCPACALVYGAELPVADPADTGPGEDTLADLRAAVEAARRWAMDLELRAEAARSTLGAIRARVPASWWESEVGQKVTAALAVLDGPQHDTGREGS